jgi:hypothetical protein
LIQTGVVTVHDANPETLEVQLEGIAVVICWLLAIGFFVKKLLKKRRRRQQQQVAPKESASTNDSIEVEYSYGAVDSSSPEEEEAADDIDIGIDDDDWNRLPTSSQPWTVVSLTTLGFLDEISYFPALILGHIFSVWELVLGTLLAGILMLAIQVFLATQCKPLMDFLNDRVPLYGIITVFATILTLHLLWDIFM